MTLLYFACSVIQVFLACLRKVSGRAFPAYALGQWLLAIARSAPLVQNPTSNKGASGLRFDFFPLSTPARCRLVRDRKNSPSNRVI